MVKIGPAAADMANKQSTPATTVSKGSWSAREFVQSGIDKVSSNKDTLYKIAGVAVGLAAVGAAVYYGNDLYNLLNTRNVTSLDPTNAESLNAATSAPAEGTDVGIIPEFDVNNMMGLDHAETIPSSTSAPAEGTDVGIIPEFDVNNMMGLDHAEIIPSPTLSPTSAPATGTDEGFIPEPDARKLSGIDKIDFSEVQSAVFSKLADLPHPIKDIEGNLMILAAGIATAIAYKTVKLCCRCLCQRPRAGGAVVP